MRIRLSYGLGGLEVDVPDDAAVVYPRDADPVTDPGAEVRRVLRAPVAGPPLRDLVRRGQKVAISVCDGTRAQPREIMIPAILAELDGVVDLADVVVLVATGTHRANTPDELRAMFGDAVAGAVRIVNHDARDRSSLTWVGTYGAAVPVWLNTE